MIRHQTNGTDKGTLNMQIKQLGKVVDKLYENIQRKSGGNQDRDNLYSLIWKKVKNSPLKEMDYDNSLNEDLIWNVKKRYVPLNKTPFGVAPSIVRKLRSETI